MLPPEPAGGPLPPLPAELDLQELRRTVRALATQLAAVEARPEPPPQPPVLIPVPAPVPGPAPAAVPSAGGARPAYWERRHVRASRARVGRR